MIELKISAASAAELHAEMFVLLGRQEPGAGAPTCGPVVDATAAPVTAGVEPEASGGSSAGATAPAVHNTATETPAKARGGRTKKAPEAVPPTPPTAEPAPPPSPPGEAAPQLTYEAFKASMQDLTSGSDDGMIVALAVLGVHECHGMKDAKAKDSATWSAILDGTKRVLADAGAVKDLTEWDPNDRAGLAVIAKKFLG